MADKVKYTREGKVVKPATAITPMGYVDPQQRRLGETQSEYTSRMQKYHSAELRKRAAVAEQKRKEAAAAEEKARKAYEEKARRYQMYKERRKLNPNNPENKKK